MIEARKEKMPVTCLFGCHTSDSWQNLYALEEEARRVLLSTDKKLLVVVESADSSEEISEAIFKDTQAGRSVIPWAYRRTGHIKPSDDVNKRTAFMLGVNQNVYQQCRMETLDRINQSFPGRLLVLFESSPGGDVEINDFLDWSERMQENYLAQAYFGSFDAGIGCFILHTEAWAQYQQDREKRLVKSIEKKSTLDSLAAVIVLFGAGHTFLSTRFDPDKFEVRSRLIDVSPFFYSPAEVLQRILTCDPEVSLSKVNYYQAYLGGIYFGLSPKTNDPIDFNDSCQRALVFAQSFYGMKDVRKFEKMVRSVGWEDAVAAWGF